MAGRIDDAGRAGADSGVIPLAGVAWLGRTLAESSASISGNSKPMNHAERPPPRAFALRPWFLWVVCAVAVMQAWAFVENVIDQDWVLATCFGLATVAFVVQAVALVWLRRRAMVRRR